MSTPAWARFDLLVAHLRDGVTIQDLTGRVIYANQVGAQMSGYESPDALLAAPLGDYARMFHVTLPDGSPVQIADLPGRKALVSGQAEIVLRVRDLVTQDVRWSDVRSFAVNDADGAPAFVVNMIRDVTDLRRATELAEEHAKWLARLQRLTVGLSRSVTAADVTDLVVTLGKTSFEADRATVWLMTPDRKTLNLVAHAGLPEDIAAETQSIPIGAPYGVAEAVRSGEPVFVESQANLVTRYTSLADITRSTNTHAGAALPIKVGGDIIGGITLGYHNEYQFSPDYITAVKTFSKELGQALERTRALADLETARAAADSANAAKSGFLATMSHELRTPINAVLGFIDLLEMGIKKGDRASEEHYISRIRRNTAHLLDLINDVLDWSKVEAGRVTIDSRNQLARDVIFDALYILSQQAADRELKLESSVADGATYLGDRLRVKQILLNLLSNGIKFTPPQGRVILECVTNGSVTTFSVHDTGIGVASEHMDSIFEPFVQAQNGYARAHGGTGLGLPISRRLARLMGGDVVVQRSTTGKGSTFVLTLPSRLA